MANYDPRVARAYNEAIAAGLSPSQAEDAAGITDENAYLYTVGTDGTLQRAAVGPGLRPNETIVPAGQSIDDGDNDGDIFQNARVTSQNTTTTQTTQITGGGSTTRTVVPTQYQNNANSNAIQAQANDLAAQKQARSDAIRAAGGTGADVLRDPEFRRLSNEQTAKEYEAQQARTPVPNTGGIVTTVTPGADQTITTQTVDGNFVTNRGSGFDQQSQAIEANTIGFNRVDVSEPGAIPGVTVFGSSLAQDTGGVPTGQIRQSPAPAPAPIVIEDDIEGGAVGFPEGTFAGNGYGFEYNEDGELIPFDSAEAERIRSTPADTQGEFAGNGYGFEYNEDGELVPAEDPFVPDAFDAAEITPDSDPGIPTGQLGGATPDDIALVREPQPPLGLTYQYNDVDGYDIFDADGNYITTVNDEAQAILYIQDAEADGIGFANTRDAALNLDTEARAEQQAPAGLQSQINNARQQASIQQNRNRPATSDWRVRLKLLPQADYLYKDPANAGILRPLRDQDGVIFPYMPRISTSYVANYDKYDLTHSNYRGYFYKNSSVQEVTIDGVFTAQDTKEAEYLLAVIHFFRSVTKMFYGQDKYRGAPPPLVELFGLGQYQFNYHPCLISQFSYNLPNDVDYIRTDINNFGLNLSPRQERVSSSSSPTVSSVLRKITNGLNDGAEPQRRDVGVIRQTVSGLGVTTYVPTKMNVNITLLPVQNRRQISSEFSVKEFANGVLLRGGFW